MIQFNKVPQSFFYFLFQKVFIIAIGDFLKLGMLLT